MESNSLSELGRWTRESREAKAARLFRAEYQRVRCGERKEDREERETETEISRNLQRVPSSFQLSTGQSMCTRKLPESREATK